MHNILTRFTPRGRFPTAHGINKYQINSQSANKFSLLHHLEHRSGLDGNLGLLGTDPIRFQLILMSHSRVQGNRSCSADRHHSAESAYKLAPSSTADYQ